MSKCRVEASRKEERNESDNDRDRGGKGEDTTDEENYSKIVTDVETERQRQGDTEVGNKEARAGAVTGIAHEVETKAEKQKQ
eukprot:751696-Hanusia_phi.AAC.6